jgi:hypothetical protein
LVTGVAVNTKLNKSNKEVESLRNDIIRLAQKKVPITQAEIDSINGKIKFIKNLCQLRGISVEKLAKKMLPDTGVISKTKNNLDEYRPCKSTKICTGLVKKEKNGQIIK